VLSGHYDDSLAIIPLFIHALRNHQCLNWPLAQGFASNYFCDEVFGFHAAVSDEFI